MMLVDRSVTDICFEGTSIMSVTFFLKKKINVCFTIHPPMFCYRQQLCVLLCAAMMQFPSLSWGWSCGAAPWRTTWRWSTRQRNWPRSSATRLAGTLGRSSAPCWTLQTLTPSCSTTPSLRKPAAGTQRASLISIQGFGRVTQAWIFAGFFRIVVYIQVWWRKLIVNR